MAVFYFLYFTKCAEKREGKGKDNIAKMADRQLFSVKPEMASILILYVRERGSNVGCKALKLSGNELVISFQTLRRLSSG